MQPVQDKPPVQIPGIAACIHLMEQYQMLPNIRRHSLVVARVADQLVSWLCSNGYGAHLNRELIIAGALLHDIAKTICLDGSCNHDRVGAEICRKHGYPEIAEIVAEHVTPTIYEPERYAQGVFLPEEIVYYADKRVNHCEIVSLNDRVAYIRNKYAHQSPERHERITRSFERCRELEHHLFIHCGFAPHQLKKL